MGVSDEVLEEEKIGDFRRQIDELDQKIAQYLNERAKIVRRIRDLKAQAQLPIFDPQREQEILTRLAVTNKGPLADRDLQEIYKKVLHYMRNFE